MNNDRFKFRVWDPAKSEFITGLHVLDCDGFLCYVERPYFFENSPSDDNLIIQQCTGLKDKNGKLIYEGDILETSDGFFGPSYIGWCDKCLGYQIWFWDKNNSECYACMGDFFISDLPDDIFVMGNIFENEDELHDFVSKCEEAMGEIES